MHTLDRLIKFMTLGENDASVEKTVIKLAAASVLEILKDTIPNYKVSLITSFSVDLLTFYPPFPDRRSRQPRQECQVEEGHAQAPQI